MREHIVRYTCDRDNCFNVNEPYRDRDSIPKDWHQFSDGTIVCPTHAPAGPKPRRSGALAMAVAFAQSLIAEETQWEQRNRMVWVHPNGVKVGDPLDGSVVTRIGPGECGMGPDVWVAR